jgi:hypothetical protein
MRIRFITEGNLDSRGYHFDSNDENKIEQTIIDDIGFYLINTFPKKFEIVEFDPPKEVPTVVDAETTPVTKKQVVRSEPKKRRKPKTVPEENTSVKKNNNLL